MITVKDIQRSLDIDGQDKLIQLCIDSAEASIMVAIDPRINVKFYRMYDDFNSAVALLAEYYIQAKTDPSLKKPFQIDHLILKLQNEIED